MFESISTERLVLRQPRLSDMDAFHAYRNEPDVARWQDWPIPFLRERAAVVIGEAATLSDLGSGEWMMLTIADSADTEVFGDVFVEFENDGKTGAIGYSLATERWGNGYATEAIAAVVDWLFSVRSLQRVAALIHPDNLRSARVVERCGFVFEGRLRHSMVHRGTPTDDMVYGLTPEISTEWTSRPMGRPDVVELIDVDPKRLRDLVSLEVHQSQDHLVSPIVASLAQAGFPPTYRTVPEVPWPRMVEADGELVGFVMVAKPNAESPDPYLWRLLIDRRHQQRGIGRRVLQGVVDEVRSWGAEGLLVSYVEGVGSPKPFYDAFGFVPTGEIDDGETVARLVL